MKYKCKNKECKDYNKIVVEHTTITRYVLGKAIDTTAPCPKCKSVRKKIEVDKGICTAMQSGNNSNLCNK